MRATPVLVAVNVLIFIVQMMPGIGDVLTETFALTLSSAFSGAVWQFFTYMFLHGGFMHIFFNMFALLIFGLTVEDALGRDRYLTLYFVSGIGSAAVYAALSIAFSIPGVFTIPMLGASGAIFAVLAAYGMLFPKNWIFIYPGIPMPAVLAVAAFAVIEFLSGAFEIAPGIANFGHLGGIVFGVIMAAYYRRQDKKKHPLFVTHDDVEFVWE